MDEWKRMIYDAIKRALTRGDLSFPDARRAIGIDPAIPGSDYGYKVFMGKNAAGEYVVYEVRQVSPPLRSGEVDGGE